MRSPAASRVQQGPTQISITSPGNEEIIQAGESSPPAEKIYVAVGKDLFESVYALKWALDNRLAASVILLHVQVPLRYIPSPMGHIPVNKARTDVLNSHKNDEQEKLNDCMKVYLEICSRVKVKAEPLVVEKAAVSRGIVEVVSELDIRILIMGTTSAGSAISKKMKMQGPGKAVYVQRHAIRSCEVLIICKGKLVLVRKGFPLHNVAAQKPRSNKASLNQLLWKRSETFIVGPSSVQSDLSDSLIRNVQLDLDASIQTAVNGERRPPLAELLNDPGHEASLDRKAAIEQLSSESEEIHSQPTESDESMEPEPPGNASWIRTSEGYEEAVSTEIKALKFMLGEALQEAAEAKRQAQMETEKRKKAEVAAIKAIHRFRQNEAVFKEAAKQKEDASSLLRLTKHQCEEIASQRDEALEELETIGQKLRSLETQVNESSRQRYEKMQELEAARQKLVALEGQNLRILQEKDAAIQQLQDYLHFRPGIETMTSASPKNLEFIEYSFESIKASTRDFSDDLKLGEGGYGTVYKGEIKETPVAVKILRENNILQGEREFQQEIDLLRCIRHPHLVRIVGACYVRGCILYEYMSNGSLADRMSCKNDTPPLPWHARIRIATEVCSALHFLHSVKPDPIVHRDLKPQNILLDEKYVSKISDFGLARTLPELDLLSETELRGTFSYIDPEYARTGELATKSDVYSVGVVILQLLTGKPAIGLVREVKHAMDSGKLQEILDPCAGEWPPMQTTQLANFALHCAESHRNKRADLEPDVMKFLDELQKFAVAASKPGTSVQPGYKSVQNAQERHDPSFFMCPIFKEVMENPYVAADGFTYEMEAIEGWFHSGNDTSPMTNVKLDHMKLIPNHSLRSAIRQWQEKGDFMYLMNYE